MFFGSTASGWSMLGYALATPVVLLLGLLRASFYVQSLPRLAASAGGVYMVGMLAIMYALYRSAALIVLYCTARRGGRERLSHRQHHRCTPF